MAAGWIEDQIGYRAFFIWVCLATLPSFLVAARLRIEPGYGRKAAPGA
jgi:PAT family beta-lactamase induction signal transducer AmpG